MKLTELRLGNLVYGADGKSIIEISPAWFAFKNSEYLSPIPLTEEWFVKFGFEKDSMGYWYKGDSIYGFVDRGDLGFMLVISDIEYKETYVKVVHKLQNIYYELETEELTIKILTV